MGHDVEARRVAGLTVFQLLEALEGDLELERVRKGRGVVQHGHVDDVYEGHVASEGSLREAEPAVVVNWPLTLRTEIVQWKTRDEEWATGFFFFFFFFFEGN